jgi:hypothetical protein
MADIITAAEAALRSRIASERGLPVSLTDRLRGNTAEELEADADALLALFPTVPQSTRPPLGAGGDVVSQAGNVTGGAARFEARKANPKGLFS